MTRAGSIRKMAVILIANLKSKIGRVEEWLRAQARPLELMLFCFASYGQPPPLPRADLRRRRWLRRRCLVEPNSFWYRLELPNAAKAASVAINDEGAWILTKEWEVSQFDL